MEFQNEDESYYLHASLEEKNYANDINILKEGIIMNEVVKVIKSLPPNDRKFLKKILSNAPIWVLDAFQIVTFPKDKAFVKENGISDTVYILVEGRVKARDFHMYGTVYDYTWYQPIHIFGAMEFLTGYDTYITTLITMTQCKLLKISRGAFEKWMMNDINAVLEQTKIATHFLLAQGKKERIFLFTQGVERIYYLLLQSYKQTSVNKKCTIYLTRDELANCSGLNIRTVTRAIKQLVDDNYITKNGRKIVITEEQYEKIKQLIADKIEQLED